MQRSQFFNIPTEYKEVLEYIKNQSQKNITESEAIDKLNDPKRSSNFIIGKEINGSEAKSKFFELYLKDVRTDESYFQMTPSVVFCKGVLELNSDGKLKIKPDAPFQFREVNSTFEFDDKGELFLNDHTLDCLNEKSSCIIS